MGTLTNTASWYRQAFGPGPDTGYFNDSHNPKMNKPEQTPGQPKVKKNKPGLPSAPGNPAPAPDVGTEAVGGGGNSPLGEDAIEAGGLALPRMSRRISDDSIADNARKILRTAGRIYTLAEQRELEDEFHPRGARNLNELDLRGTHYEDE
jgi:hypothetical protein